MLAFRNDQAVKDKYIARVRAHREADQLVQGTGARGEGADFRGCAVGCTLDVYDHSRYPVELGIPEELAQLEDSIFEGLKAADAQTWPERFLAAAPVGADLSLVWPRFALWLLETELKDYATSAPVAALYRRWIGGNKPSVAEWRKAAAQAAWSAEAARASAQAAWSAARASAQAAWSAEAAAAQAAWSAAAQAAAAEARYAFWQRAADKLTELLAAAPVARA